MFDLSPDQRVRKVLHACIIWFKISYDAGSCVYGPERNCSSGSSWCTIMLIQRSWYPKKREKKVRKGKSGEVDSFHLKMIAGGYRRKKKEERKIRSRRYSTKESHLEFVSAWSENRERERRGLSDRNVCWLQFYFILYFFFDLKHQKISFVPFFIAFSLLFSSLIFSGLATPWQNDDEKLFLQKNNLKIILGTSERISVHNFFSSLWD